MTTLPASPVSATPSSVRLGAMSQLAGSAADHDRVTALD